MENSDTLPFTVVILEHFPYTVLASSIPTVSDCQLLIVLIVLLLLSLRALLCRLHCCTGCNARLAVSSVCSAGCVQCLLTCNCADYTTVRTADTAHTAFVACAAAASCIATKYKVQSTKRTRAKEKQRSKDPKYKVQSSSRLIAVPTAQVAMLRLYCCDADCRLECLQRCCAV